MWCFSDRLVKTLKIPRSFVYIYAVTCYFHSSVEPGDFGDISVRVSLDGGVGLEFEFTVSYYTILIHYRSCIQYLSVPRTQIQTKTFTIIDVEKFMDDQLCVCTPASGSFAQLLSWENSLGTWCQLTPKLYYVQLAILKVFMCRNTLSF